MKPGFINNRLSGWNAMRMLRVSLGLFCIGDALVQKSMLTGVIGSILLYQGVFNAGCCGVSSCSPQQPLSASEGEKEQEITFEEIKVK